MKDGYIGIDCKNLDLTKGSTPQTISGLYAKLQSVMGIDKPIYAHNCIWGTGVKITPIQIFAIQFDGYIIATASTLQVIITNEDSVTINNLAPSE